MDNQNINDNQNKIEESQVNNMSEEVSNVQSNQIVDNTHIKEVNTEKDLGDKTIEAVENFVNTTDHSNEYNPQELKENKTFAIISYIPLVVFYFIITGKYKKSNYLHFHVNQGLNVTLVWIIAFFVSQILSAIFKKESLLLNSTPGWVSFISYVFYCIGFLLTLFGVINTVNDCSKELPVIGKYKLLK